MGLRGSKRAIVLGEEEGMVKAAVMHHKKGCGGVCYGACTGTEWPWSHAEELSRGCPCHDRPLWASAVSKHTNRLARCPIKPALVVSDGRLALSLSPMSDSQSCDFVSQPHPSSAVADDGARDIRRRHVPANHLHGATLGSCAGSLLSSWTLSPSRLHVLVLKAQSDHRAASHRTADCTPQGEWSWRPGAQ